MRTVPSETALVEEVDANYKEWEVTARIIDVRTMAALNSKVIANITEGDIVEGHRDLLMLENRVLCMRIRIPHHSTYPEPFGWVTVDSRSIGGKFYCKQLDPPVPDDTVGQFH